MDPTLNILAVLTGVLAGVVFWFVASYFVAKGVIRSFDRDPDHGPSAASRVFEVTALVTIFLVSLGVAVTVAALLWVP